MGVTLFFERQTDEKGTYYVFTVHVRAEDLAAALAAYDPASPTSPAVGYCRPIARDVLDAAIAAGLTP